MSRSDYFAMRIKHFLTGYRKKNELTQSELAKNIGTTKSTVSRIENNQDKHVTQVLSMLERLGQLEDMDLGAFLAYLDAKNTASESSELFPWQRTVLKSLVDVKQSLRLDFITELMPLETSELEGLLSLLIQIHRLSPNSKELISKLVHELH